MHAESLQNNVSYIFITQRYTVLYVTHDRLQIKFVINVKHFQLCYYVQEITDLRFVLSRRQYNLSAQPINDVVTHAHQCTAFDLAIYSKAFR